MKMGKKIKNLKFNKKDAITLAVVFAIYIFFFVMVLSGAASNQLKSMIIPISYNIVLALSLKCTLLKFKYFNKGKPFTVFDFFAFNEKLFNL